MKISVKRVIYVILLTAVFVFEAQARNEYLAWWAESYPLSNSDQAACQLCHERASGGNGWNRYGWSLRSALGVQSASEPAFKFALSDIENVSDGAGSFYISQINSNALPGWLVGNNNRIRTLIVNGDGQPEIAETFISPRFVRPCGLLIDPPNLMGNESEQERATEIKRVQTCSTSNPLPSEILKEGPVLTLQEVASGFTAPVAAVNAPGQDDVLYLIEQGGLVWHVNVKTGEKRLFLDFSNELVGDFGQRFGGYDERGLLGFVFHPNYATNNKVYTYISADFDQSEIDFTTLEAGEVADHMSVVSEWVVVNPLSSTSQASGKKTIMTVAQPQFNHNGGMLNFGPEGYLYIAFGDGGNKNDEGDERVNGHGTDGNGRDNTTVLGSILRIDINSPAPLNGRYRVPQSNPFVGKPGLDEIFVYGLRNPYRFSIEESSDGNGHALYIGDVGQDAIEEINRIPLEGGSNFGWNYKEGSFYFSVIEGSTFVSPVAPPGIKIPSLVDPIVEYDHNEGLSVIAGFVYNGSSIQELKNRYIFGDWGRSFAEPDGRLFFINVDSQLREVRIEQGVNMHVTGFGRDDSGEVYVVGNSGVSVLNEGQGSLKKLVYAYNDFCFPIKSKASQVSMICL